MNKFLKYLVYVVATITVLIAFLVVYFVWFQPAFYFPKPTGQYAVGYKEYHWIDTNRKEIYSDDPKHPYRELMVKIWYPANGTLPEKPTTPYAPYLIDYYKKDMGLFWRIFGGLNRRVYVYAQSDLTIASDIPQFPVIIFSHGYGCTRDSNIAQCEELASHGYIVVGISHTYDSSIVKFTDGHIVNEATPEQKKLNKEANWTERKKWFDREIEIWVADVQFVLDRVKQLAKDKNSIFGGHLDLEHIGILGHSFGGATAIQLCRRNTRIKACINMDGPLYGINAQKNFDKPIMFMLAGNGFHAQTPKNWKELGITSLAEKKHSRSTIGFFAIEQFAKLFNRNIYMFTVKDAGHMAFTDFVLLKHTPLIFHFSDNLDGGSINGFRATTIINDYLVNFFDKYLKNRPSPLLDGAGTAYPEVETKLWGK